MIKDFIKELMEVVYEITIICVPILILSYFKGGLSEINILIFLILNVFFRLNRKINNMNVNLEIKSDYKISNVNIKKGG